MSKHVTISPTEAADRLAIRELIEAYAHCADRRDAKGQMSLFTADAHFEVYMNAKDPTPSQELHSREVGPLGYADFLSLSPGGERMRRLVDVARFYSGPTLSFDVQLVLAKEAIPKCQLLEKNAILGWNTWAKSLPSMHDSYDAIHSPER